VPQQSRARVVLLQHPREARNPLGTARMAHLSLPGSRLYVGVGFEDQPELAELIRAERDRSVVLYPSADARPIEELAAREGPLTVYAIDGTWWQARKIWQRNAWLREMPAYRLEPQAPAIIEAIRPEPEAHCLSTVEALALALDAIDGEPGRHAGMLRPLEALVERQLGFTTDDRKSLRRRARPRPHREPELPAPLEGRLEKALIVHVEANGWPARLDPRPKTELVQLLATRPATGERFCAFVRPELGFAPDTLSLLGLDAGLFDSALDRAGMARSWAGFVRPDDVWCAWGFTPQRLLEELGIGASMALDLRVFSHARLKARPVSIEAALPLLGGGDAQPRFPGRGGRRLAILERLFEKLVLECAERAAA
jgi:DTW domain-containing protein YfiP